MVSATVGAPLARPDLEPAAELDGPDHPPSAIQPSPDDIERWTDRYFVKSKETIGRFGDMTVTYAVFMRRPVIFTPRLAAGREFLRQRR